MGKGKYIRKKETTLNSFTTELTRPSSWVTKGSGKAEDFYGNKTTNTVLFIFSTSMHEFIAIPILPLDNIMETFYKLLTENYLAYIILICNMEQYRFFQFLRWSK